MTDGSPNLCQKTRTNNYHLKKKKRIGDIAVPADHRIKLKDYEKNNKYLDLARELKQYMEHEGDNCTNCDWCFCYSNKEIIKGTWGFGSWLRSGDQANYYIIENGQNTEKSPKDLKRLVVTQTQRVWSASPVVWGLLRSAVFWSARLNRVLPQHWRFPPVSVGRLPRLLPPYEGWGLLSGAWSPPYQGECQRGRG